MTKLRAWLQHMKDPVGLGIPAVYSISCSCCQVYIRQTGHRVIEKIKEDQWYIELKKPDKSGLAEHYVTFNHVMIFVEAQVEAQGNWFWDCVILDAIFNIYRIPCGKQG